MSLEERQKLHGTPPFRHACLAGMLPTVSDIEQALDELVVALDVEDAGGDQRAT
jgi:hypothetical protein